MWVVFKLGLGLVIVSGLYIGWVAWALKHDRLDLGVPTAAYHRAVEQMRQDKQHQQSQRRYKRGSRILMLVFFVSIFVLTLMDQLASSAQPLMLGVTMLIFVLLWLLIVIYVWGQVKQARRFAVKRQHASSRVRVRRRLSQMAFVIFLVGFLVVGLSYIWLIPDMIGL
ncbi:hypothetical protein [Lactiplantibacillus daowaiensis]|uniref:Integral membrane protein n=1 Tax=Lactiplantibacillus daowaiensis TaxID=2559918 RepID=A0ABW1S056_9LACO|nr:hypothetical protein [Lactiplantibacillus daowaiensis]